MITDLRLQHFRSYTDSSFEFTPGVNIIVGPNASGKTNLLEALLVIARGSSYRVKDSTELVQFGENWARLDTHSEVNGQRTFKLELQPKIQKTYEIDNKIYKRLTSQHSLPIVLFEPNHLYLLHGGPERRRDYLDDLLEQTKPQYGTLRRQYKRTLAQRNRLLKQPNSLAYATVFPWDVRLSQLAGQVVAARQEISLQINEKLPALYKELSKAETEVELQYKSTWKPEGYETNMLKKLEAGFGDDRARGFTSYGPHREDTLILFDDRLGSETASRGEVRTTVLALKIIELEILRMHHKISPFFLLDDVFGELDGKRRHALTERLATVQTFITTTEADIVVQHFSGDCNILTTR